jgi:hypothetical protein
MTMIQVSDRYWHDFQLPTQKHFDIFTAIVAEDEIFIILKIDCDCSL